MAHGGQPAESNQIGRCLDALLDALANLEIVEESFRMEGMSPLAADELNCALTDTRQAAPRVR